MSLPARLKQHALVAAGTISLFLLVLHQTLQAFFEIQAFFPAKITLFTIAIIWLVVELSKKPRERKGKKKKPTIPTWLPTAFLFSVIVLAVALRLYGLGDLGLSTDEGSTALFSHAIATTGLPCIDGECYLRGIPYLYVVAFFTGLFGTAEFWVRLPGIAITVAVIPLVYFLTRRISNYPTAILAVTLVALTDWNMMLSRYARMYNLLLLFILISIVLLYHYLKKESWWKGALLVVSAGLAMVTHQFGLLLIYIPIHLGLTKRPFTLKDGALSAAILLVAGFTLTQIPGLIYDQGFLSIYEIVPERLQSDQYWFLANFQIPQFTYFKELFTYQAPLFALVIAGVVNQCLKLRHKGWKKIDPSILSFFYGFLTAIFVALALYNINYSLKYLWWILTLMLIPGSIIITRVFQKRTWVGAAFAALLLLANAPGVFAVITRDHGDRQDDRLLLMSSEAEIYYPDDKTPVEHVVDNMQAGDIIITDYFIQNVYLELQTGRQSDYFILPESPVRYLQEYPYYGLFQVDDTWRLREHGSEIIHTSTQIAQIAANADSTIWIITAVDFKDKQHKISNSLITQYIRKNFTGSLVYTGEDNTSRVYRIDPSTDE